MVKLSKQEFLKKYGDFKVCFESSDKCEIKFSGQYCCISDFHQNTIIELSVRKDLKSKSLTHFLDLNDVSFCPIKYLDFFKAKVINYEGKVIFQY